MALKPKKLDTVRSTIPVGDVGRLARININVPDPVRREWKVAAIDRGISLTALVELAVSEYLNK